MRGCSIVLYVAVLLSLLNCAFAAGCGTHGSTSSKAASICLCDSGYSGAACDTGRGAECPVLSDQDIMPAADVATHFPKLVPGNATVFRQNKLYAKISGPYTVDRKYTELEFAGSDDDKCSFGSVDSYWTITQNCEDTFALVLPWTEHGHCGFDKSSETADSLVIAAKLHLKYVDTVYIPLGLDEDSNTNVSLPLARVVSIPYYMSVTFQKTIEVQLLALNITSDVKYGAALTLDEYEPVSGVLTLVVTTVINYPNSFRFTTAEFHHPETVEALHPADMAPWKTTDGNVQFASGNYQLDCPIYEDVPCHQNWQVQLKISELGNCSFDGEYYFTLELYTCRGESDGTDQRCTMVQSNITFSLQTNYVCGEIGITPGVTGHLVPFAHKTGSEIANYNSFLKSRFKLGEYGNFYAAIESDGNDIKINFTDIRFREKRISNDATWVYLWQNTQAVALNEHAQVSVDTVFHEQKYFRVYFHSSVFPVPPSGGVTYTFSATVDILFTGNEGEQKKRTVEYTFESSSLSPETEVGLSAATLVKANKNSEIASTNPGPSSLTFIGSVVGAIAGTMIIVFVVVGFALRSRAQSDKRDFAASSAVVAANAAAQSIDVAVSRA